MVTCGFDRVGKILQNTPLKSIENVCFFIVFLKGVAGAALSNEIGPLSKLSF